MTPRRIPTRIEPVQLHTARLVLDQPTLADAGAIHAWLQEPVFARVLRALPLPYTEADAVDFVTRFVPGGWRGGREQTWAIRIDGAFAGVIGCRLGGVQDVGYWLGAPFRGRGIMGEALDAVLAYRFAEGQSVVRWECVVGNVASAAVARRAGFRFTGTGPASLPGRNGETPDSWHGELHASDDRAVQGGWPAV